MSKKVLRKKYLVTKQNVLNEMRSNNMTLQELRLFSIYLSKINPQDSSTRIVRFPLIDFQAIMDLSQVKIAYFKDIARSLLSKMVDVPTERGGFTMFGLFRIFKVDIDNKGEWYVEIDAEDEALPLMFDYKSHYFKYELWNALRLKSKNQLRMYEILKQYEKIGYRIVPIAELRGMLGIGENEYPRFGDFKTHVLEVCRHALMEYTDISYTYESHGKKGPGGKILQIKFNVTKNKGFIDPLSLEKFIDTKQKNFIDGDTLDDYAELDD